MDDLFDKNLEEALRKDAPLADRIRPEDFDYFFGQEELVGESSPLRRAIQNDNLTSLIFWGPPGSGKTTLARIIAKKTKADFVKFSAVVTGINDVRKAIEKARERLKFKRQKTILFIDEIHRFNKAQQDAFLPYVEDGTIVLIGATTENPSFSVISPLLSRSAVYVLKPLSRDALKSILLQALKNKDRGFGNSEIKVEEKAFERLINFADGDARVGLNGLEFIVNHLKAEKKNIIKADEVSEILKEHALRYDKKGEEHYNIISAFIKSMRDSDPNGALYWLARMVESGEDPRFIARRMVIFASEDIGNADPQAIQMATAIAHAVEYVGFPEAQINLAHGVTYLATAPKSNASYSALLEAKEDAKKGAFGVPLYLRNAVTNLMKKIGYGKGYQYAHNVPGKKPEQTHFPEEIGEKQYYHPEK
ncbi:replication-associated recombination protein A [Patescibacteria group bacterium]|nr:replication-associated recombination protein A [Patescibacteria group bacterium]MBU4023224.1 replication-associated recombination protein A [Patescibacteria group bacterium]MBU4162186.1 replication-associated recombination protein A [Patescibacteria group bacterium]